MLGQIVVAPLQEHVYEGFQVVQTAQSAPAQVRAPGQQESLGWDLHVEQPPEHHARITLLNRMGRNADALQSVAYQLAALGSTSDTKPFDQCIVAYMTNVITNGI